MVFLLCMTNFFGVCVRTHPLHDLRVGPHFMGVAMTPSPVRVTVATSSVGVPVVTVPVAFVLMGVSMVATTTAMGVTVTCPTMLEKKEGQPISSSSVYFRSKYHRLFIIPKKVKIK